MKARFILLLALLVLPTVEAFACATCMGAKGSATSANMAVAIWVMLGAILSVLAGVSAFGIHLWRHSSIPLEPHEQLIDEDLEKYD